MKIDARGLACPQPVIKTKEALGMIDEGMVEILVDNEGAVGNIERLAQSKSLACSVTKDGECWRVNISKGAKGKAASDTPAVCPVVGEQTFLIVATDSLGKDEALGRILMIRFFETMAAGPDAPHTIFFLNAAVRLTTTEDSVVPQIAKLAGNGVQVFSCGTCLKFYELESALKVGKTGSIDQVVDAVMGPQRVVWV
jgi:selenium metabolism protein YedF